MSEAAEELRQTLAKMQAQLEAARARRAARPAAIRPAPMPAMPMLPVPQPARGGRLKRLLAPGLGLLAAAGGLWMGSPMIAAAGLMLAVAFLTWSFAGSAGGSDSEDFGELARRITLLERRAAAAGGSASGLEEEFQELRTILQSLMKALDKSEEGKDGKA